MLLHKGVALTLVQKLLVLNQLIMERLTSENFIILVNLRKQKIQMLFSDPFWLYTLLIFNVIFRHAQSRRNSTYHMLCATDGIMQTISTKKKIFFFFNDLLTYK